jgi:hypothetical protein
MQKLEGKTKTWNHRGHREAQRKIPLSGTKAVLCRRFALMNADFRSKTKN